MLDRNDLEAIILFNEKTEKLKKSSFTNKIISEGFGFTISAKESESVKVEKRFPISESVDAFVFTIRFFCQNNERSSFGNIAKIYSKLPDYRQEKTACLNTCKEFNNYLDLSDENLKIELNGEILTNRTIFDIFVYGGLAHANRDKKKIYDQWMADQLLKVILEHKFIEILSAFLHTILYIHELNDSLIIDFNCFRL